MVNNRWSKKPGAAVRITVDGNGIPYVVNRGKAIYKWNSRTNNWRRMSGAANDIGVSSKGGLWVIGNRREGGGYAIYRWRYNRWNKVSGSAMRIAVSPRGPWVVNKAGSIYQRSSGRWNKKSGCAKDIGAGANGSVWIIGCNRVGGGYGIYKWTGRTWTRTAGGATNISVDRKGNPFVVNSSGSVYWDRSIYLKPPKAKKVVLYYYLQQEFEKRTYFNTTKIVIK